MDHQARTGQQPIQQPSSTMSGSTPSLHNDGGNIFATIHQLAFPESRSSCTPEEMFAGRICLRLLGRSLAEKRLLLTCSKTPGNKEVASFALPAFLPLGQQSDGSMLEFQQRLKGTLEPLHDILQAHQLAPVMLQPSEENAIALRDQFLATLSPVGDRAVYIFLHVFGNVPDLWRLLVRAKPSEGPDGKGKGRAEDINSLAAPIPPTYQLRPAAGTSQLGPVLSSDQGGRSAPYPLPPEVWQQSEFSRHQPERPAVHEVPVQGTLGSISRRSSQFPPFDPPSAPLPAPAPTPGNVDAMNPATPFAQGVPPTYRPRPAARTSQLGPVLSSDQGGRSAPYPLPPEVWQQSEFSRHQPEHPAVDEAPVQGTSGTIPRQSPQLPPFDLSGLSNELYSAEQGFNLPESEMNDLGQAAAALQRHLGAGSSVTSLPLGDLPPTELPDPPPQYMHFKTGRGVRMCDATRLIAEWHWWMLDFQDKCEVVGLEVPDDFRAELDKVDWAKKFLTLIGLHLTRQLQD